MSTQRRLESGNLYTDDFFSTTLLQDGVLCFIRTWICVEGEGEEHIGEVGGGGFFTKAFHKSRLNFSFFVEKVTGDLATE